MNTLERAKSWFESYVNGEIKTDLTVSHGICRMMADFADTLLAEKDGEQPPLCPIHKSLDESGHLEMHFGNDCVACSLNERVELLQMLEPHADGDSINSLAKVIQKDGEKDAEIERLKRLVHFAALLDVDDASGTFDVKENGKLLGYGGLPIEAINSAEANYQRNSRRKTMSSVQETIEAIRELPDGQEMDCYAANGAGYLGPTMHVADLKALVSEYERLRQAVEHYADKENWKAVPDPAFDPDMHHYYEPKDDEIWQNYEHGYEIAQAALSPDNQEK